LIATEGLCPIDHPYVALSHSLGDQLEGLVQANIDDWLKYLPTTGMPPLFYGATSVAEELGFRYIWIDTVCVIQDSEIDQSIELSRRGLVFQHCSINLTADSANSFFRMLDQKYSVASQSAERESATCLTTQTMIPENIWSAEMVNSSLARESSYFQDHLFAPCRLHFGKTELYWQCTELKACESFPNGLPSQLLQNPVNDTAAERILRQIQMLSGSKLQRACAQSECSSPVSWRVAWHQIVNQYSQCSLSIPFNKLLQIAGIASEFEALSGDRYIAGLWQGGLINDLLWYTDGAARQRSSGCHVPTWSWASIEGVIKYLPTASLFGNFVEIVDVEAGTNDRSSLDEHMSSGILKLNGYLLKILPSPFSADSVFPDCHDDITNGHHYLLPLRLQRSAPRNYLCGLVLRRTEETFISTYERIGMFRFNEGNSVHILGHEIYGTAYVFPRDLETWSIPSLGTRTSLSSDCFKLAGDTT
jgi:hypothetical protein